MFDRRRLTTQWMIVLAISLGGENAGFTETADQWLQRLQHTDPAISESAAYDIEQIHPSVANINQLFAALAAPDARVRRYIVATLGEIAATREAAPYRRQIAAAIAPSLKHYDQRLRAQAMAALAKCGPEAVDTLTPMLTDTRIVDQPGYVGLYLADRNDRQGVTVRGTIKNSPAAAAGFKKDDVLVRLNHTDVFSRSQFTSLVTYSKPADHVQMTVRRGNHLVHLAVRVGHRSIEAKDEYWQHHATKVCEQAAATIRILTPQSNEFFHQHLQHDNPLVRRVASAIVASENATGPPPLDASTAPSRATGLPETAPESPSVERIAIGLRHPDVLERLESLESITNEFMNDELYRQLGALTTDAFPTVRFAAARLAVHYDPIAAQSDPLILKALMDGLTQRDFDRQMDEIRRLLQASIDEDARCMACEASSANTDESGPITPPCRDGGKPDDGERLADFWPPPQQIAAWETLDVKQVHPDAKTMEDVFHWIQSDLQFSGFRENHVMNAPGGFALVTSLERIHTDGPLRGSSFRGDSPSDPTRWTRHKLPARSLWDCFDHLLYAKPGTHRLFAFIVTDQESLQNQRRQMMAADDLHSLQGTCRVLPNETKGIPVNDHFIHVLVYQFERRLGGRFAVCETRNEVSCHVALSALEHLQLANLHAVAHHLNSRR
ncbi:PDZ domain-containing protein [Neorhodopirellula pilleata]|uniref:PDZ domain-containing protein n=1 Tax=Neorhodopirellula pilleata TaxID=2714738 RepID=A0A5C5ZM79_9BACT|nr:PDZ domain-containing protein [Neorhodopirellula pilleata]TWT87951.1 hypothetical protein Pla100_58030 [Neorhodopirellula pilleata]